MRTTRAWGIVIVLQGVILAGQWLGVPSLPPAQAQPAFNPERDRMEMIGQLKSINDKLDRMHALFESGNVQVKVNMPDDKRADRPGR
jgi:hypothetical protein